MSSTRSGMKFREPAIFERGSAGRIGHSLPTGAYAAIDELPEQFRRKTPPALPEVSELEAVRHFTRLSQWNYGIDLGMYPLGSCTMKFNPRVNEEMARLAGFAHLHPYMPTSMSQGALELMVGLEGLLSEISGMHAISLQPAAGAQGEFTGMRMIRQRLIERGETQRNRVLIPDTAHGTNPASCALNSFEVVSVKSGERGILTAADLREHLDDRVAALMMTNPNTLGLFEEDVAEIADLLHENGAYLYCDGANMNALLGRARPGDMGVDVMQFNLHKTFSTPHGGGGPGSGPIGVSKELEPLLPSPRIVREGEKWVVQYDNPRSIGQVKAFFGNFGMFVRAYTYIRELGSEGLKKISDMAVLNANYVRTRLTDSYHVPFNRPCLHECVITDKTQLKASGIKTLDIAKRLIDYGYHPPTVYFPICIQGAIMIEPTESESLESLDEFVDSMIAIAEEAKDSPEVLKEAPSMPVVARMDETRAARNPQLRWHSSESSSG